MNQSPEFDCVKPARDSILAKDGRRIRWEDSLFLLQNGEYLDRADKPLFKTSHSLNSIRQEVVSAMPDETNEYGFRQLAFDQIFMPFVQDADPFWLTGVSRGAFNQSYAPFTCFYYVLREHPEEFFHFVESTSIQTEKDYNRLLNKFNSVFHRVLNGRGRGTVYGYCSVDEMIRIGSLFYLVQLASGRHSYMKLDEERRYSTDFGTPATSKLDCKTLEQYSRKLRDIYMSDMQWNQFMHRYVPLTDARTMWFFNVPNFLDDRYPSGGESVHQWFNQDHLMGMVDLMPSITKRNGYALAVIKKTDALVRSAKHLFGFTDKVSDSLYRSESGLYFDTNFAKGYYPYCVISNYLLPQHHGNL